MSRGQQPRRCESSALVVVSQARPSASYPGMDPSILRIEARIFAMTRQEAQYDPGMIFVLLSIYSMDAYIIIDLGSTHSFISVVFA